MVTELRTRVLVCVIVADNSSYDTVMSDRINSFTRYQWQIHEVCLSVFLAVPLVSPESVRQRQLDRLRMASLQGPVWGSAKEFYWHSSVVLHAASDIAIPSVTLVSRAEVVLSIELNCPREHIPACGLCFAVVTFVLTL